MTAVADPVEDQPKKKSKMPLILGIVLAFTGGGGGFMAVKSGFVGNSGDSGSHAEAVQEEAATELPPMAFVALDTLLVSLPGNGTRSYLRFGAQLEVRPEYLVEVEAIKPRIVDVLNSYLRAVETAELEDPKALVRLRGQMLRRVQVVAGEGRIRDILIMEFVLN